MKEEKTLKNAFVIDDATKVTTTAGNAPTSEYTTVAEVAAQTILYDSKSTANLFNTDWVYCLLNNAQHDFANSLTFVDSGNTAVNNVAVTYLTGKGADGTSKADSWILFDFDQATWFNDANTPKYPVPASVLDLSSEQLRIRGVGGPKYNSGTNEEIFKECYVTKDGLLDTHETPTAYDDDSGPITLESFTLGGNTDSKAWMVPNVWQYVELSIATVNFALPANGLIRIDLNPGGGTNTYFQAYDATYFEFTNSAWTTGSELRWKNFATGFDITGYGSSIGAGSILKFKVKAQFAGTAGDHAFKVDVYYDAAGTNHWGSTDANATGLTTVDTTPTDAFTVNSISPAIIKQGENPTFAIDVTTVNAVSNGAASHPNRANLKVYFDKAQSFGSGTNTSQDTNAKYDDGNGTGEVTITAHWTSTV